MIHQDLINKFELPFKNKDTILSIFEKMKKYEYSEIKTCVIDKTLFEYLVEKLTIELANEYILARDIENYIENFIAKGVECDKRLCGKNINYNGKLYENIIKLTNKYRIIYYTKEKTFENLKYMNKLRYDVFGILFNKNDMQLYYFVIELDDRLHFNSSDLIFRDICKEIFAWHNCFSMLRIHYCDNIYEQLDKFFDEITNNMKPIIKYSRENIYNKRLDFM